jgi:membrane-bound lytic murein transglycosylase B
MRYFGLLPIFALLLAGCATSSAPQTDQALSPKPETAVMSATTKAPATKEAQFEAYKRALSGRALAKGYDSALIAQTIGNADYYERTLERDANQPEFTKPVWDYIRGAASPARIERGRTEMVEHRADLKSIGGIWRARLHPRQHLGTGNQLWPDHGEFRPLHDADDARF